MNVFFHRRVLKIFLCTLPYFLLGCTEKAEIVYPDHTQKVKNLMRKVCDWQLTHPVQRIDNANEMWERAVFYIGVMTTYGTTQDLKYLNAAYDWSKKNKFQTGPRKTHGDDHVIGQVYLELYDIYQDTQMIEDLKLTFDNMMEESWSGRNIWNWCDGLFMAPPVLAHLSSATQDPKYLIYMDSLWWDTYATLYEPQEDLFYRDERYKDLLNSNGNKILWSRGNGWVIAGIVRVLNHLPKNSPSYEKYLQVYLSMARSIAKKQQPDGLWQSSLTDTLEYPVSETSGTAFFTYAFAWGINQGYLDKYYYLPIVKRAWKGLSSAINQDGRLGFVQQPWDRPGPVYADGYQEYGTGAFLLAASEYIKITP